MKRFSIAIAVVFLVLLVVIQLVATIAAPNFSEKSLRLLFIGAVFIGFAVIFNKNKR